MSAMTPQQKIDYKQHQAKLILLKNLFNRIKIDHSLNKTCNTWFDFYKYFYSEGELEYVWQFDISKLYYNLNLTIKITHHEIKEQEEIFNLKEEQRYRVLGCNQTSNSESYFYYDEWSEAKPTNQSLGEESIKGNFNLLIADSNRTETNSQKNERAAKEQLVQPLPVFTRPPTTKLFGFQNRAVRQGYEKLVLEHKRGCLIQAGTGTGKTFIAGGLIEQFWNPELKWFDGCFSPWPVVYITRASIVEQTSRVMKNSFGLDPIRHCMVINIEQLRSKFGTFVLEEKTVVERGESHIRWVWRPNMHPRLVIVDESHLAKNEESTQSKIIQSLAEIMCPKFRVICMSATAFMRICEARYLCVNLHKEIE